MVCIIDDREDVWNHATNLIHVKPYHFFQHTGDINAPPGLDKHEDDDKGGVDLTNIKKNVTKAANNTLEVVNGKDTEIEDAKLEEIGSKEINGCSQETDDKAKEATKPENDVNITNKLEKEKTASDSTAVCTIEETQVENIKNNGEKVEANSMEVISVEEQTENKNCNTDETDNADQQDSSKTVPQNKEEDLIEIEDPDDYLLYLEDILKRIHHTFYEKYDRMESGAVPDLKKVIPDVRSQVLKGTKLVFSGLVPTHVKLEQSKAYQVARSLGAEVTQDLEDDTTHLVAVRPGTAKVNAGRRKKNLKIVTPDWLWACAECWEHLEEKIFPLNSKGSKNRHPPPHCSSPEHVSSYPVHDTPALRRRTPSGRFMDTINPLMSFSSADIADMDKEVCLLMILMYKLKD